MQYSQLVASFGLSGSRHARQSKMVAILKRELANIRTDLDVATGSLSSKKNAKEMFELSGLLKKHKGVKEKVKVRKLVVDALDLQIKQMKERIIEMKKSIVTEVQFGMRVMEGRNNLEKLENKLCTINRSFGAIQAENMVLKDEIDHYLKERSELLFGID